MAPIEFIARGFDNFPNKAVSFGAFALFVGPKKIYEVIVKWSYSKANFYPELENRVICATS